MTTRLSLRRDNLGQSTSDHRVVGDSSVGHVNRRNPGRVGLDFAEPLRTNPLAAHAVGRAVGERLFQFRQLMFFDGDNHFAAAVVGQSFALAKLLHRLLASRQLMPATNQADNKRRSGARPSCGPFDASRRRLLSPARSPFCRETARESDTPSSKPDNAAANDDQVALLHIFRKSALRPECRGKMVSAVLQWYWTQWRLAIMTRVTISDAVLGTLGTAAEEAELCRCGRASRGLFSLGSSISPVRVSLGQRQSFRRRVRALAAAKPKATLPSKCSTSPAEPLMYRQYRWKRSAAKSTRA